MKSRGGFTLVEILIVVVILGILAAIVVPQFTNASEEAKTSRLMQDLQTVRSQLELYKIQHTGDLPGSTSAEIITALTGYTDVLGATAVAGAPGTFGPYMQKMPANPFAFTGNETLIQPVAVAGAAGAGDGSTGWAFNLVTGAFTANDDDPNHVAF